MKNLFISSILIGTISLVTTSCQSPGSGALVGAGTGAAAGAILGNNVNGISRGEGAVGGAVIGGLLGGAYGRQQQQINALQYQQNTTVVNVSNSNGSMTPVTLTRVGGTQWRGPRGEIYTGVPSQSQLRQVYGM